MEQKYACKDLGLTMLASCKHSGIENNSHSELKINQCKNFNNIDHVGDGEPRSNPVEDQLGLE